MKNEEIKKVVREGYAKIAREDTSCCGAVGCGCGSTNVAVDIGKSIGYSDDELHSVPEGANLGLGCGNPVALASLKAGETVLDLGSGAGFDCFLASSRVGENGRVIGVDMTPDMLEKARSNAGKGNYNNVEFRLGEIENLPVADNAVDAIISNCVINLSPDKAKVFSEAFRVLKPGGRLMVSDIVLLKELPGSIKDSIQAYIGCLSGALLKADYLGAITAAGFQNVEIVDEALFPINSMVNDPTAKVIIKTLAAIPSEEIEAAASSVMSIKVQGIKSN